MLNLPDAEFLPQLVGISLALAHPNQQRLLLLQVCIKKNIINIFTYDEPYHHISPESFSNLFLIRHMRVKNFLL